MIPDSSVPSSACVYRNKVQTGEARAAHVVIHLEVFFWRPYSGDEETLRGCRKKNLRWFEFNRLLAGAAHHRKAPRGRL